MSIHLLCYPKTDISQPHRDAHLVPETNVNTKMGVILAGHAPPPFRSCLASALRARVGASLAMRRPPPAGRRGRS